MKPLITLLMLVALLSCTANPMAQTKQYSTGFSNAELDQMLAPIALYPDTVLSHVLIASTYPLEIVQAHRWSTAHSNLEGEAAVNAADNEDWDPSVKALVAFPQVLERMSSDLAWTQQVGDAFLDNESRVMDAIQNLRNKAYASGSLDKLPHVQVQREQEIIIIEPAVQRVVYVPVYDTRIVYGNWWWPDYPPVYWRYPSYQYVSGFYWGSGIHIGSSFYFSSFHWPRRQVVYVDHRHYAHRPHFHSGRSIVDYRGARHWQHNPGHRRGVAYYNTDTRHRFSSNRPTTYERYQQRANRDAITPGNRIQEHRNRPDQPTVNRDGDRRPQGDNRANELRERLQRDGNINRNDPRRPSSDQWSRENRGTTGDSSRTRQTQPTVHQRDDNARGTQQASPPRSTFERGSQLRERRQDTERQRPTEARPDNNSRAFSNSGSDRRVAPERQPRESRMQRPASEQQRSNRTERPSRGERSGS